MSGYAHLKREALQFVQKSGGGGELPVWIREQVPALILSQWIKKFYQCTRPVPTLLQNPRLINRYTIGADPEMCFYNQGELIPAAHLDLIAALCCGADNNGRLVELRPAPSRFALEVVASLFLEMHWMTVVFPQTGGLTWKGGAWTGHDGLGGHIHFGRKKLALLKSEVDALSNVTRILHGTGLFDSTEIRARLVHTSYGQLDDFRRQRHGYEYRALPSWIGNPWQAYLCLVLMKLAIFDPGMVPTLNSAPNGATSRKMVRTLLANYKDRDDDARIAYAGLDVWGLPTVSTEDVRGAWGIAILPRHEEKKRETKRLLLPTAITPDPATVLALFQHIVSGKPLLPPQLETPPWPHSVVPTGFVAIQHRLKTVQAPGLAEATWDLLMPEVEQFVVARSNLESATIELCEEFWYRIGKERRDEFTQQFPEIELKKGGTTQQPGTIRIGRALFEPGRIMTLRRALQSGLFPLYPFGSEGNYNPAAWSNKKASQTFYSKLLNVAK